MLLPLQLNNLLEPQEGALVGTTSLTFTVAGTLTGTGALTGTTSLTFTASGTLTDATPPAVVPEEKGGRTRIRRYLIEVDGEQFAFPTISDVLHFLEEVRESAPKAAESVPEFKPVPKPPKVKVRLVSGRQTQSKAIQREIRKTQSVVNSAYQRIAERRQKAREIDDEISRLINQRLDEEDTIIALLM